jgi:arsenate reductase-like glutaredoxin family protein
VRFDLNDVKELLSRVDTIASSRGIKVNVLQLNRDKPPDPDEVAQLTLGPSGFLRAPAVIADRKMLVGFSGELYAGLLD